MPWKTKEARQEYYQQNKDIINAKRRAYRRRPNVRKRENERTQVWRKNNLQRAKEISNKAKKEYEGRMKNAVFEYYGKKCVCCGEDEMTFLTIDHVNGGGRRHREKIKSKLNVWLVQNNFPEGFQTLCFNCNWGKHISDGVCPHKMKKNL